jgi:hypothetical protein
LTIHGSGQVEQKAVRHFTGQPATVAREDVLDLVRLLLHHEAWTQLAADRTLIPDESRAQLTILYGGTQTAIWERHHDLSGNQRIVEIRDRMQQIAWRAPTAPAE